MNIYLQSTGKKRRKNLNLTTVFSRKLLLYLSDYKRGLIDNIATEKQTEILSTFNNMR